MITIKSIQEKKIDAIAMDLIQAHEAFGLQFSPEGVDAFKRQVAEHSSEELKIKIMQFRFLAVLSKLEITMLWKHQAIDVQIENSLDNLRNLLAETICSHDNIDTIALAMGDILKKVDLPDSSQGVISKDIDQVLSIADQKLSEIRLARFLADALLNANYFAHDAKLVQHDYADVALGDLIENKIH
jgi:hypothetical protein